MNPDESIHDQSVEIQIISEPLDRQIPPAFSFGQRIQILVGANAWEQISEHAVSDLDREVGGIMLGSINRIDNDLIVYVKGAIPATRGVINTSASLQFNGDTWAQFLGEWENGYPGLTLVGWYHTHPKTSVFFSAQDDFFHRFFFAESWQIALVLNPVDRVHAFFQWEEGQIVEAKDFFLQMPKGKY